MHVRIEHQGKQIVAKIVMFFADDPGALFRLQIGQARGGDTQGIFQVVGKFLLQPGADHALEEHIQPLAFPPAVHIAFAQPQRPLLQNAFKEIGVFNLNIEGARSVDFNAGQAEHFMRDTVPLIILDTQIFYTR